jgi:hypothetical protein
MTHHPDARVERPGRLDEIRIDSCSFTELDQSHNAAGFIAPRPRGRALALRVLSGCAHTRRFDLDWLADRATADEAIGRRASAVDLR